MIVPEVWENVYKSCYFSSFVASVQSWSLEERLQQNKQRRQVPLNFLLDFLNICQVPDKGGIEAVAWRTVPGRRDKRRLFIITTATVPKRSLWVSYKLKGNSL